MGIEFLIKDKMSEELVVWCFTVNSLWYVDVYIEGKITDTLLELGRLESYETLENKVTEQLVAWGIEWHSYAHTV